MDSLCYCPSISSIFLVGWILDRKDASELRNVISFSHVISLTFIKCENSSIYQYLSYISIISVSVSYHDHVASAIPVVRKG